jgi:hypothetical protein
MAYPGEDIVFTIEMLYNYDFMSIQWFVNDVHLATTREWHWTLKAGFQNNTKIMARIFFTNGGGTLGNSTVAYATIATPPQSTYAPLAINIAGSTESDVRQWNSDEDIELRLFLAEVWSVNLTNHFWGHNLTYKWTQNGHDIITPFTFINNGAIQSVFDSTNESVFQLTVTNRLGSICSPKIVVKANVPELIDFPEDIYAFEGDYIDISAKFISTRMLTVQWQLDSGNLEGQVNSYIRFKAKLEMDQAFLTIVANNPAGSTHKTAVIHVYIPRWAIALAAIGSVGVATAIIVYVLRRKNIVKCTNNREQNREQTKVPDIAVDTDAKLVVLED